MSKEVKPTTGNGLETEMQVLKNNDITNNSSDKKEETPAIQNQAASTTLGDLDALAELKAKMQGK